MIISSRVCRSVAALSALFVVASAARAVGITPGQTDVQVQDSPTLPSGTKLAEKVQPFTLNFAHPGDAGGLSDMDANGTLTTSVYRNATGLAFVYDVFVEPTTYDQPQFARAPVNELSQIVARGFAGLSTDVSGDFRGHNTIFYASRSADGSTVSGKLGDGVGGLPTLIVQTNATAFDELGTTTFNAADEFLVTPSNQQVARDASVTLSGTYRPVPEPAAAGLVVAGGMLVLRRSRRH
jgi:hypothetical protein